ncbi:cupin domain-containing protein [Clostridium taeniosporum]|uniref:Cupin domain-containing protein n=1 Tax=Clostridium taeniosporum TaxID=394958 RepID=A0A1D7XJZ4_9CLOT|nr:cupin domain-containing protein [Clostridium taeniosporum]AOR23671.1 cupin domain-containing protein [Clostridium taeniosporum]
MKLERKEVKVINKNVSKFINIDKIKESKKIISSNGKFKAIYFSFEENKGLPNHVHNGYASIFVYEGNVKMEFETGEKIELNKGDFMPFDARIKHNVIATIKSKVLVTISE